MASKDSFQQIQVFKRMFEVKFRLLMFYLVFSNLPNDKIANGLVTGKMQFYKSKYFDERSIHADLGRDMSVECNHVKALSGGKQNNQDSDVIKYANDINVNTGDGGVMTYANDGYFDERGNTNQYDENVYGDNRVGHVMIETKGVNPEGLGNDKAVKISITNNDASVNNNNEHENIVQKEPLVEMKSDIAGTAATPVRSKELKTICDKTNAEQPEKQITNTDTNGFVSDCSRGENSIYKREIVGGNPNMETDNQEIMVEKRNRPSQTAPLGSHQTKRLMNSHKQFGNPEEAFRKKNSQIVKHDSIKNLADVNVENQYHNNYLLQNPNLPSQMSLENGQVDGAPNYQSYQENPGIESQSLTRDESEIKENPTMSRLFAKQRQIENLKQLLMQVESKFQMEVNEVGRLQQSVAEAERELDEAVKLLQEVKMRNIKGLQHIEAAQDAAGRNLESKALKAHAEESQLAMHDQVLFSERQRLNALRAQMIYLQTELAAAQNSGILTFDDGEKNGFQSYGFHYRSPSLADSLKYFQNSPNKQGKSFGPYMTNELPPGSSDSIGTPQKI